MKKAKVVLKLKPNVKPPYYEPTLQLTEHPNNELQLTLYDPREDEFGEFFTLNEQGRRTLAAALLAGLP